VACILSSFCVDVDMNVVEAVDKQTKDTNYTEISDMTRFYILGSGVTNPVMRYAKTAMTLIDEIYDVYMQFELFIQMYYPSCRPLEDIQMKKIAKEARKVLVKCIQLLEPQNIYPYYNIVVREAICGDLMHSLASFPIFTLVLGLGIFPYGVVLTHRYLVRWAWWKQEHEKGGHSDGSPRSSIDAGSGDDDDSDNDSSDDESGSDDESPKKPNRRDLERRGVS